MENREEIFLGNAYSMKIEFDPVRLCDVSTYWCFRVIWKTAATKKVIERQVQEMEEDQAADLCFSNIIKFENKLVNEQ